MPIVHMLRALALGTALAAAPALASELVINADKTDPPSKKMMDAVIADFQAEYPAITVKWNNFDHEGYKSAIRNFLTANPPDIFAWYPGNRMMPFVKAGLVEDVTDVWEKNKLDDTLKSSAKSVEADGKKWGVPYSYYPWAIYYRKDIFDKLGIAPPKTWNELLAACAALKTADITPFAIGTKALWPAGGWFDYLDLRVNGYEFHMDLTAGEVSYEDPRVKAVFEKWAELVRPGYFLENNAAIDWQEAIPQFVQGKAAMYLMGNFAVPMMKDGGLKAEQIGFVPFPEVTPGVPRAEDAPTEAFFAASGGNNKADARTFLAYLARPDVQAKMNGFTGQIAANNRSPSPNDPLLKAATETLATAYGLAQFYDRDAPAEMAKAGMEGFQQFMQSPDKLDAILARLNKVRSRAYGE
ncbi:extracellular solute-binding protein [Ensifer sp. ENS09]|uniref:ABC transporter substrate-binding protein n=1 Tax=Ensifer sp. ENS09 TaxID=2769263 RepID=UPI00178723CC|nr:extracellular solute-binding protein [Ensifer sp. ENS09]MBD9650073.1 extracellular solute-binding protein [Ensifer sp. ENS09]